MSFVFVLSLLFFYMFVSSMCGIVLRFVSLFSLCFSFYCRYLRAIFLPFLLLSSLIPIFVRFPAISSSFVLAPLSSLCSSSYFAVVFFICYLLFFFMIRRPLSSPLFHYTTLFTSIQWQTLDYSAISYAVFFLAASRRSSSPS